MDNDYYDQLRKKSVEVFGHYEEAQLEQEEESEEQKVDENPELEMKENEECQDISGGDDPDQTQPEYKCVLDVCGLKLSVSSEDEEIVETARRSLTGFFKHYIKLE